jgi:anti-anti-sigma factor
MPEPTCDHFSVEVEHRDATTVLRLAGEFDVLAEPAFRQALDDARLDAASVVEAHLGDLAFLDSTGLRCLVLCSRRVRRLVLVDPTAPVEAVLVVGGLGDVFEVRKRSETASMAAQLTERDARATA